MRVTFVKKLEELAEQNKDIFMLTADLGKFFDGFKRNYPDRFIDMGVAEANMIGTAAGLSLIGKNVYCYSIIPFLVMRAFEQIRIDLCFHNLNVKLFGAGAGLAYGFEGTTHFAIEDMALMRALPNMTVVSPGDKFEVLALAETSLVHQGPLYMRFGNDNTKDVYQKIPEFKIGKGNVIYEGDDIAIIATGSFLYPAKSVSDMLRRKNISVTLISMHTVKPLDQRLVKDVAAKSKAIFTMEEHSLIGGLGSAVADILMDIGYRGFFKKFALPDAFPSRSGTSDYLYKKFGLSAENICESIVEEYKRV